MRKARLFTAVTVDGCLVENLDWLPDTQGQTFLFDHQTWKQLESRLKTEENITVLSPRPKRVRAVFIMKPEMRQSVCGG